MRLALRANEQGRKTPNDITHTHTHIYICIKYRSDVMSALKVYNGVSVVSLRGIVSLYGLFIQVQGKEGYLQAG
jgi:hypothetical protein